MARRARVVRLTSEERERLERVVRAQTSEQRAVKRAQVALLADEGLTNEEIAPIAGLSVQKVSKWRRRVAEEGVESLADRPRPGGPRRYGHDDRLRVFTTACSPPPEGETHWTVRSLAAALGRSKSWVHAVLDDADLKPHQVRSWLTSLDPDFETKQAEVCGLYLAPPEGAIVVSIDEKTGVQAREPIRTEIALQPGRPARREFEYKRHGTVALLAALLVPQRRDQGRRLRAQQPRRVPRLPRCSKPRSQPASRCTRSSTTCRCTRHPRSAPGSPNTRAGSSTSRPRTRPGSTRSSSGFSILSRRLLKRGAFHSKDDLKGQLLAFIERYNPTAKPFAWTYAGKPLTQ